MTTTGMSGWDILAYPHYYTNILLARRTSDDVVNLKVVTETSHAVYMRAR
jgi:hypothetical protein